MLLYEKTRHFMQNLVESLFICDSNATFNPISACVNLGNRRNTIYKIKQ